MKPNAMLKPAFAALCGLLLITGCATHGDKNGNATADTVYRNGKIYTVNEKAPWAEAVAIKGGKFI